MLDRISSRQSWTNWSRWRNSWRIWSRIWTWL